MQKDSVEISLLVSAENGQDLAFCKIKDADKKSTVDVFNSINDTIQKIKKGRDVNHKKRTFLFTYLPTFLISPMLEIMHFIVNGLGFSVKAFGSDKYPFGSLIITNVGSYGYENLYAPFPTFAGAPILFTVGTICKKPKVIDNEIKIRECITISFTIDHRYTDGARAIRLLSKFKTYIHDPEKYLDDRTSTWDFVQTWKA